jgi:hypothetical protein
MVKYGMFRWRGFTVVYCLNCDFRMIYLIFVISSAHIFLR